MEAVMEGYTPTMTLPMEMTDQIQVAGVNLCRDTISPLQMDASSDIIRIQILISVSSTMAEYIAFSDCAHDCAWYKILFGKLRKLMPHVSIYGDSHGVIFNTQNL